MQQLDSFDIPFDFIIVDVGANDGVRGSHSRNLILSGWKAILIDPNPDCIRRLEWLYKNNKFVDIKCVAISNSLDHLVLQSSSTFKFDGSASLLPNTADRLIGNKYLDVSTDRLSSVLNKSTLFSSRSIGVLSIDTEGHDLKVLSTLDGISPIIIITERGVPYVDELHCKQQFLSSLGYALIYRTYSNDIYLRMDCFSSISLPCF